MNYIYYFTYGSNMLEERFEAYINGGESRFNKKTHTGCSDKTKYYRNDGAVKFEISNYKLHFAKKSPSWENKGVAFIKESENDNLIGRLYKVTEEQFKEIKKQEGKWYQREIIFDEKKDGLEIKTFTNHDNNLKENKPSNQYLNVIKDGLKELGLENEEINIYLNSK